MKLIIPRDVDAIINILFKEGFEAYAVGGCVRDSFLKKKPNDWDICTSAKPEAIMDIFKHMGLKTIPTGLKHGTVTLIVNDNHYEVTTYRIEGDYEGNRRPKNVIFTKNVQKDLSRRDFTINAMAYNDFNGLIDPFDGKKDLYNKTIRAVGLADERFKEDALRILRGVRFATQLKFDIEADTISGMKGNKDLLKNISKERIREELDKILLSDKPSIGFNIMRELGLLEYVIPELEKAIGFDQKNPHHHKSVFNHIMEVLDNTEKDVITRLAGLLHDIGKPECFTIDEDGIGHFYTHHMIGSDMAEDILKRLKYDNNTIDTVKTLVREHMSKYDKLSNKGVKRFINRVSKENLGRMFNLQRADVKGSKPPHDMSQVDYMENRCEEIINAKQPLTVKDLEINGYDLMELGINPGKKLGEILDFLLDQVLEYPEYNSKEKLINIVKKEFL